MRKNVIPKNEIMNFDFQIARSEPAHFHQNIELFYVLEGHAQFRIADQEYAAGSDDIVVVNPNKRHSYQASEDILMGYFQINFQRLSEILGTNEILFWCNSTVSKNASYEELRKIMKRIINQYPDKSGPGRIVLESLYYMLLNVLVAHFLVRSYDKTQMDRQDPGKARQTQIVSYINANFNRKLSLNELADHFFLTVPYLSKYIKHNLGLNFVDYLNKIRMFHAVDDLLYTDKSMIEIAMDNGFSNTTAFNELFKKMYDTIPSQYRRQYCQPVSAEGENEQEMKEITRRVNDYLNHDKDPLLPDSSDSRRHILVDAGKTEEYNRYWNKMINVGRAGDLIRSDMQEHILILKEEIGFRYVRFWDIFSSEMQINETEAEGKYNFEKLDKVLDFLMDHDIKPYIEMGYKPNNLYRTVAKTIVSEKREIAFKDLDSFRRFLSTLAVHLTNRYGQEEIEQWYFEQWSGENVEQGSMNENFFDVFNALYETFKKISPRIKVGGGGLAIQFGSGNLIQMVNSWSRQEHLPDFLSLYCYPYIKGDEDGVSYAKISTDRYFLRNQLMMASSIIENSGLKDVEIHVTEWSSTISNRNILNDSCYKGAYVMKSVIDCMDLADVLGYWVGSDIFSEHFDNSRLLYGGCGLLSKDGIKKPAFYAYYFLSSLGKYRIHMEENSIVTTNGHDSYYIACHNYRHLNYRYYLKTEDEIELDKQSQLFEDRLPLKMNFRFSHVRNGRYKIKTYALNDESGSVQEEWEKMGLSDHLTRQEVDYLKRICIPYIQIKEYEVHDETLSFELNIQAQEIMFIHISYLFE